MRFISATVCTALLAVCCTWFFPWWTIAPAAACSALLIRQKPAAAFLSGFTGIALLWIVWGWIVSYNNSFLLLGKMAQLFHLPYPWLYNAVSGFAGGLTGGLAAWSISLLQKGPGHKQQLQ